MQIIIEIIVHALVVPPFLHSCGTAHSVLQILCDFYNRNLYERRCTYVAVQGDMVRADSVKGTVCVVPFTSVPVLRVLCQSMPAS